MARPKNGRLSRTRVEFSLPPAVADAVYHYAKSADMSLSQAGAELLRSGLEERRGAATRLSENIAAAPSSLSAVRRKGVSNTIK
jgi:hypothetical protein